SRRAKRYRPAAPGLPQWGHTDRHRSRAQWADSRLASRTLQRTIDLAAMTIDRAGTAKGHQAHLTLLARLKTHSRASGNVQAHAIGSRALKNEGAVDLKKMIMAADLHRAISAVAHKQSGCGASGVGLNVACIFVEQIFSWMHYFSLYLIFSQL